MKILIVSATTFEIAPLFEHLGVSLAHGKNFFSIEHNGNTIDFLITGVGMVATVYHTTKAALATKYDFAINAGVCGSFNKNLEIGSVVNVYHDSLSELGAEDGNDFLTLNDLNLPGESEFENKTLFKNKELDILPKVNAITVNTTHGNEDTIGKVFDRFRPIVESMEGAAFMMVCNEEKVSYVQIRAVSNFVELRNKNNWNIPLAIENLNRTIFAILNSL